jgi:peroxiredoxin
MANPIRTCLSARNLYDLLGLLALVGVAMPAARADFKVGAEIPAFSLKSADGQPIELLRSDGALVIQIGQERTTPKALIIHLLQPDCLQCRAQIQALKPIAARYQEQGVVTLGIAHRGTPDDARKMAQSLALPFPIAIGVDSAIATQFAAGDTLGIADAAGIVRFAQVGYGHGDAELWKQALEQIVAGKDVTNPGVDRERLAVGDRLPAIHLPSLHTGKPMSLAGEGDRIIFRNEDGKESRPKAVVGFFSRY